VSYEWDFESDGVYDATGVTVSHAYGQFGSYTATLRVTNDNTPPTTATVTVVVKVNHAPVADPGDLTFSASGGHGAGRLGLQRP